MPIDLSKLRADAAELDKPPEADIDASARRALQSARGALNADAFPPGQEPDSDPVSDAIVAGRAAGGRGSDEAMAAYAEKAFSAAQRGDPRVSSQGVVDGETRDRWMADAHARQIRNRDQSGMTQR